MWGQVTRNFPYCEQHAINAGMCLMVNKADGVSIDPDRDKKYPSKIFNQVHHTGCYHASNLQIQNYLR